MIFLKYGALSIDDLTKEITFKLSEYEKNAINFCKAWQGGAQEFLLHTSGSTGIPKTIRLTRDQMQASAVLTQNALNLRQSDHAFVCLNTQYIAGQMMLVRGLQIGMDMTIVEPASNPFLNRVHASIDFIAVVPLQLKTILLNPNAAALIKYTRNILVGGGPIDKELINSLQVLQGNIYGTFGMTETVSHIALRKLNGDDQSDNYTVVDGIDVAIDHRGCLVVSGAVTNNQQIITNDLVQLINSRSFKWIGRADNVINSGGIKIFPEQIEAVIAQLLKECEIENNFFVCGIPDLLLGEQVVLVLEGNPMDENKIQKLKERFFTAFNKYQTPKKILFVPEIILTNNKIDRTRNKLILLEKL